MAARGCLRLANLMNKSTRTDINGTSVQLHNLVLSAYHHSICRPCDQSGEIVKYEDNMDITTRSVSTLHLSCRLHKQVTYPPVPKNGILSISNLGTGVVARNFNGAAPAYCSSGVDDPGSFEKFNISPQIQERLRCNGITSLFPVQYETFVRTIEGKDIIVQARTGTGKTLSFALPIVEKLEASQRKKNQIGKPVVLVLEPTRELACQVTEEFQKLLIDSKITPVYGGTSISAQERSLNSGVDIVVGTPGRVKDMMNRQSLSLSQIDHIILDEVDRMLDMGFANDVEEIIKGCYEGPKRPQTMLYSATLPNWVKDTARQYLKRDYETVSLIKDDTVRASETVKQLALCCPRYEHKGVIKDLMRLYCGVDGRTMIFCTTKLEANGLGGIHLPNRSAVLHGDIAQNRREFIIKGFKEGSVKTLITTDVAARGLDIPNVQLVIQTSPPKDRENFIHRTGRTGRAGKDGIAICLFEREEKSVLNLCEKEANIKLQFIPPPQPTNNVNKNIDDIEKRLKTVPKKIVELFREHAFNVTAQGRTEDTLAAAFAIISGCAEMKTRSLLSCKSGYTAYIFTPAKKIPNVSFVSSLLSRTLGEEVNVSDAVFTKDRQAVVFEVPAQYENALDNYIPLEGEKVEKATNLPALEERAFEYAQERKPYRRGDPFDSRPPYTNMNRFSNTSNRRRFDNYSRPQKNNDKFNRFNNQHKRRSDDWDEFDDEFVEKSSFQNRGKRRDFF